MQGKTVGLVYPDGLVVEGITVDIQSEDLFKYCYQQLYGESPRGILGYALFRRKQALIKDGLLHRVMAVTGHELGHLLTPGLFSWRDEEAKATAFEWAWCLAIQRHNIANLGNTIMQRLLLQSTFREPDSDVKALIQDGYEPLQLYWDIANDKLRTYSGIYGENYIPLK